MKSNLWVAGFVLVAFVIFAGSALADDERDTLVRFKGGIGVHPVSNVAGIQNAANGSFPDVTRNVVKGVNPAGQLWVIDKLDAKVKTNGDIKVEGKGLVLAGGNGIGSPPANPTRVFATLICEAAAPFIEHSTTLTGVLLAPNGDFKIDDVLVPMPDGCASPVLLIRSANGGAWFAAGIPAAAGNSSHGDN
jgi:hypothetical protein